MNTPDPSRPSRSRSRSWSWSWSILLAACSPQTPQAGTDYQTPKVVHASLTPNEPCTDCHEAGSSATLLNDQRPAAFDGVTHGAGGDCTQCHNSKDDNSGDLTEWLPRKDFNHVPKPASCLPCHVTELPPPPHVPVAECAGCHDYPVFKG